MSKEIKKVEIEETEEVETNVEMVPEEGIATKTKGWFKRNGKKIVAGAAVIAGLGLAFVLGKRQTEEESNEDDDGELDAIDVDYEEVNDKSEEV